MMKKTLFSFLLTVVLLCTCCFSAFAESLLLPLFEEGQTLLFDTSNVTLQGRADFFLDGVRFKTAEALYIQDQTSSLWNLNLWTPREGLPDLESGYTVIANDSQIFVMEKYYPGVYRSDYIFPESTIVSPSVRSDQLVSVTRSIVPLMESLLPGSALTLQDPVSADESAPLQVTLSADTVPEVLNDLLNLAAQFAVRRFIGIEYDQLRSGVHASFEDYLTVTDAILYTTSFFRLEDTSFVVRADTQGRLTGMTGSLSVRLFPVQEAERLLLVNFDISVSDYGTSCVPAFDPSVYNVTPAVSGLLPGDDPIGLLPQDESVCKDFSAKALQTLTYAGYDISALPSPVVGVSHFAYRVIFENPVSYANTTVVLSPDGGLRSLSDTGALYYLTDAREASDSSLSQNAIDFLLAFLQETAPDRAADCASFVPLLEYECEGVRTVAVRAENASGQDTGILLLLEVTPAFRVVGLDFPPV